MRTAGLLDSQYHPLQALVDESYENRLACQVVFSQTIPKWN